MQSKWLLHLRLRRFGELTHSINSHTSNIDVRLSFVNPSTDCRSERSDKTFALLLLAFAMELVFFKFIPDLGTATLPNQGPSILTNFKVFENTFSAPGSVMHPRFAGPWILLTVAKFLAPYLHSSDIRLHPLRVAAAILTPVYAIVGIAPVLVWSTRYRWRIYVVLYCSYCVLSLYVFYPYDMPSIALLSVAAFLMLEGRLGATLITMLLIGIFRESAFHVVWFALAWALCNREVPVLRRAGWAAIYAVAFALEYVLIRVGYPGRGALLLDPHEIFFGRGLWSLTCIATLAIVAIVPVHYLVTRGLRRGSDWRHNFFLLNCAATPVWIIFYRIMGGNISELRMLIPVLLPIFYGIAMSPIAGADLANHSHNV
jgi:hypothetical protein